MAESAVMGLRIGLAASARSMMTTCEVSATFSRTQMNFVGLHRQGCKPNLLHVDAHILEL